MKQIPQKDINKVSKILKEGEVVAVPTETVYGLAASLHSKAGIEKLLKIKDRPVGSDKICSLMLPDIKALREFAELSQQELNIAFRHLPGELTMILNKRSDFKHHYFDNFDTIGIRIPAHTYMLNLLKKTGPLLVTSANPRGEAACRSGSEVKKRMPEISSIVQGQSGNSMPTTILDIRDGEPKILRQGGLLLIHF